MRTMQPSFAAGEMDPALRNRVDLAKYRVGAATLRNMVVHPQGGASNRAGFEFVGAALCEDSRLVPFVFSADQAYVLEFGEDESGTPYMRVLATIETSTGTQTGFVIDPETSAPAQIESPYPASVLRDLRFAQSADVMFITHKEYPVHQLIRLSHYNWRFVPMAFNPVITAPTNVTGVADPDPGRTNEIRYGVSAVTENGESALGGGQDPIEAFIWTGGPLSRLFNRRTRNVERTAYVKSTAHGLTAPAQVIITYRGVTYPPMTITVVDVDTFSVAEFTAQATRLPTTVFVYEDSEGERIETTEEMPSGPSIVAYGRTFRPTRNAYTLVARETRYRMPECTYRVVGADLDGYAFDIWPTWVAGSTVTLTWDEVPGALHYNVYKNSRGQWGWLGSPSDARFVDDNIEGDVGYGPRGDSIVDWDATPPSTVCLFQQRLVGAATDDKPTTLWASRLGHLEDFTISDPLREDDPVEAAPASGRVDEIVHLAPFDGLVVFTAGAEWLMNGDGSGLSSTNINFRIQSYNGCATFPGPLLVDKSLIYPQRSGQSVRDMFYNVQYESYSGDDVSLLAAHILRDNPIVDWAFLGSPDSIIWMALADGTVATLTYMRDHEVFAWCRQETDGDFLAFGAAPGTRDNDVLYAVVKRAWTYRAQCLTGRLIGASTGGWFASQWQDGTPRVWGTGAPAVPADAPPLFELSVGDDFVVGITAAGEPYGWGDNTFGQLTFPATATRLIDIAAGGRHVVALRSDGYVVSWGDDTLGQATVPADAGTPGVSISRVAAGDAHSVALAETPSGTALICWGDNSEGQCPAAITGVRLIAAGAEWTAVVRTDNGRVDYYGIVASGLDTPPTALTAGRPYIRHLHGLGQWAQAVMEDGTVEEWGDVPTSFGDMVTAETTAQPTLFVDGLDGFTWGTAPWRTCEFSSFTPIGATHEVWYWSGADPGVPGTTDKPRVYLVRFVGAAGSGLALYVDQIDSISGAPEGPVFGDWTTVTPGLRVISDSGVLRIQDKAGGPARVWRLPHEFNVTGAVVATVIANNPNNTQQWRDWEWEDGTYLVSLYWSVPDAEYVLVFAEIGVRQWQSNVGGGSVTLDFSLGVPQITAATLVDGTGTAADVSLVSTPVTEYLEVSMELSDTRLIVADARPGIYLREAYPDTPGEDVPDVQREALFIERLTRRVDRKFLDSHLTYDGAPATVITGLDHLEGATVNAIADGDAVEGLTVVAGAITLPTAASEVTVGLPYESDLKTLELDLTSQEGSNQGLRQRVGEVIVRVLDTRGVEVGPDYGSLVDARVDDSAGEFTGDVPVAIPPSWGRTAKVCIRQTLPYPMTVLGVIPEVKVGG